MCKLLFVSITVLFFSIATFGQSPYEETAKIKEKLNLPFQTLMVFDEGSKIPAKDEVKVFIGTDNKKKVAKRFTKWIRTWNKREAKDHGKMTIVSDILKADVILLRFKMREFNPQQRTTVGVNSGASRRSSAKPRIESEIYVPRPQYSYLIIRMVDSLAIVYKDKDESSRYDHTNPDKYLFNQLKKRMKNR